MARCPFCDHKNPPGATHCASCCAELPSELDAEIDPTAAQQSPFEGLAVLLASGQKIRAIELYRQRTGVGLKQAKDAVEAYERGKSVPPPTVRPSTPSAADSEVLSLLRQGKKIAAIKLYREKSGVGLAAAKAAVEAIAAQQGIPIKTSGCASVVLCVVALAIFAVQIARWM
jgi:ribosomal protein L7/L12